MRKFLSPVLLALVLCAPLTFAATTGVVVAEDDDTPIAGATVRLRRGEEYAKVRMQLVTATLPPPAASTTSNAEGAFTFNERLDGIYLLEVDHEGFEPDRYLVLAGTTGLSISMTRVTPRIGRVTAGGKPVANALVVAVTTAPLWSTHTDDEGKYSLPITTTTKVSVAIVHPDFAPYVIEKDAKSLDAVLSKGVNVSGKVVDANNRPFAKARVSAGDWSFATTADDGTFTITNAAANEKTIIATSETAFGSAERGTEAMAITLAERPTISGVVRDAKQRAIAGAIVYGRKIDGDSWASMSIADDRGAYRLRQLEAGTYSIATTSVSDLTFNAIQASPGDKNADLIAKVKPAFAGIVVDQRRRPVARATVQFTADNMPLIYAGPANQALGNPSAMTDAEGHFRLAIPDVALGETGMLRLQATRSGYAGGVANTDKPDSNITIVLADGFDVEGVVVDTKGTAVANAGVLILQDPLGATLPMDSAMSSGLLSPFLLTDANGAFKLRLNAAPHEFAVYKKGAGSARVADVVIGKTNPPLRIVLEPEALISGRVLAGEQVAGGGGRINARGEGMSFAYTDVKEDGTFTLEGLRAGEVHLEYAHQDGRTASAVVTAPTDNAIVRIKATGKVKGRVVDADTGKLLHTYSVRGSDGESSNETSVEDEDEFELEIAAGDVSLTVIAEDYDSVSQNITVTAGKTTTANIKMTHGRIVSGRVSDEIGAPIANATISVEEADSDVETEEDGIYRIAVPRGTATLGVYASNYVSKTIDLPPGNAEAHIDVVLSRGRSVHGRVLDSEGQPVGSAYISGGSTYATSNDDGTFSLSGLGEGKISISATSAGGSSAPVEIDPATHTGEIVLRLPPARGTGTVYGVVKGFEGGNWMMGMVQADGKITVIARDGKFRLQGVQEGKDVEVQAMAATADGDAGATASVKVNVTANSEVEANLEIRSDTTLRGTVYESGAPVSGRTLQFSAPQGQLIARTNPRGEYTAVGLTPGVTYNVTVAGGRSYSTTYTFNGSGRWDVRIDWMRIEGRVVDTAGVPIASADITISSPNDASLSDYISTDGVGSFITTITRVPTITLEVEHDGYTTVTQTITPGSAPIVITLQRAP